MHKPVIKEAVIVEGRYDKNTLSQIIDALIIETKGFNVFKNTQTKEYIKQMAQQQGIIILTDSDAAGFVIRNHIKSFVEEKYIKNAFVPDIYGKEKRKSSPGKEGKLGVEGMRPYVLIEALKNAGATIDDTEYMQQEQITLTDLYNVGLTGKPNSREKKAEFLKYLEYPEHLSTKDLTVAVNSKMTKAEFYEHFNIKEY